MKKMKLTAFACAALFGLTACSSSGNHGSPFSALATTGNDNGNATAPSNNSNATAPSNNGNATTPSNNGNATTPSNNGNATAPSNNGNATAPSNNGNATAPSTQQVGTAYLATKNDMANALNVKISGDKDSVVTVDGHQITVARPGITSGRFTQTSEGGVITIASGRTLSYMRFGAQTDVTPNINDNGTNHYAFAIGNITPTSGADAVPTTGRAAYKGLATLGIKNTTFVTGTSSFNVDFGAKAINGSVTHGPFTIPLAGAINGASFNGEKDGFAMQGNFYGPKAAELGGIFKGELVEGSSFTPVLGSFGASKQ